MSLSAALNSDRRFDERVPVSARARICYGKDLALWADCTIRNISRGGAKLQVPQMQPLPPLFSLIHIDEGALLRVRLKWRQPEMAGVSFLERYDLTGAVAEELEPMRRIWQGLKG